MTLQALSSVLAESPDVDLLTCVVVSCVTQYHSSLVSAVVVTSPQLHCSMRRAHKDMGERLAEAKQQETAARTWAEQAHSDAKVQLQAAHAEIKVQPC